MVIFHSYVSLPEGNQLMFCGRSAATTHTIPRRRSSLGSSRTWVCTMPHYSRPKVPLRFLQKGHIPGVWCSYRRKASMNQDICIHLHFSVLFSTFLASSSRWSCSICVLRNTWIFDAILWKVTPSGSKRWTKPSPGRSSNRPGKVM